MFRRAAASELRLPFRLAGGRPRRRSVDLLIAATANVLDVPLLTADLGDFEIVKDLVRVEPPPG